MGTRTSLDGVNCNRRCLADDRRKALLDGSIRRDPVELVVLAVKSRILVDRYAHHEEGPVHVANEDRNEVRDEANETAARLGDI